MAKTKSVIVGQLCESQDGRLYIKFENEVTTKTYKGEVVTGKFINLDKPMARLDRLKDLGFMQEDEYEKKAAAIAERPYIKYDVSIAVPKD